MENQLNKPIRTCSEICIDADNHSEDIDYLDRLWNEVVANKKKYPLVELKFIHEHLMELTKVYAKKCAKETLAFFAN